VIAARYYGADWKVIFPIYTIALLLTIVAVVPLRVRDKGNDNKAATLASCLALLKNPYVLAMVLAIFFYVGAEVSVSAGIPLFLKERFDIDINRVGLLGTGLFFTALTIGRFSGGVILNWMAPRKFFIVTCVLSIAGLLGLFVPDRNIALASFVLVGLGFANIFPLVFSIAVEAMPQKTNELSGLMVTAIVGGAFVPPVMGWVADATTVRLSFLVPLAAILYITWTALLNLKTRQASPNAELLER
jgi:fucose permease